MLKGMTKYHLLALLREPMNLVFGFALPFFFLFLGATGDEGAEVVSMVFIPMYMTIAIMVLCFTDSAMSHAYARQIKFLRLLRMTPIKPIKYIFSGILSRMGALCIFTVVFIGVATVLYDLNLARINLLLFIAVMVLIFAMFYVIGMFTANVLKGAKNSQSLVYVVFFALLIIGGNAAIQAHHLPEILQTLVRFLPPAQALFALQSAWMESSVPLWYIIGMVAYTAVFGLLSLKIFKFE